MSAYIDKLALLARSPFESDEVADHVHEAEAVRAVRAILEAMREPTHEMAMAGAFCEQRSSPIPGAIDQWRAMINKALSE